MPRPTKLSDLFEEEPDQWSLRGDPHLWREMKTRVDNFSYPDTDEQFSSLVERLYQQLVGVPLSQMEPVFVERYSHGGISSGYVSPKFWQERAIPLLVERYRASQKN